MAVFVPAGVVVCGLDETIERRRGAKIKRKGISRDPVRSSHAHFVNVSGLRWLCGMLLTPMSMGPPGVGAALDDGAVSLRALLGAAGPSGANPGAAGLAAEPIGGPLVPGRDVVFVADSRDAALEGSIRSAMVAVPVGSRGCASMPPSMIHLPGVTRGNRRPRLEGSAASDPGGGIGR